MLLAGLQRQPIGRLPARIDRQPDDAAGQRALQRIAHRHVGGVRPAIAHRHAETLRRSDRDVGAEFARRGQQRQRQQIGGDDRQRALGVQRRDRRRADRAPRLTCPDIAAARRTPRRSSRSASGIADDQIPAQRLGAGAQHRRASADAPRDRRRTILSWRLRGALGQRHRFGRRGGLVEQRGVGDVEAGEIADHGLEIEQRFQPALADLRLIRRIGGVPGRIFQDVALDHRRQDRAGIALADQRGEDLVLRRPARAYAPSASVSLQAPCRDRAAPAAGSTTAASRAISALEALRADGLQHRGDIARRGADMAAREGGGGLIGSLAVRGHAVSSCSSSHSCHPAKAGIQYAGNRRSDRCPAYWIARSAGR